jgi:hypothetical protein
LVEQLICNHQVGSSSPPAGTKLHLIDYLFSLFKLVL